MPRTRREKRLFAASWPRTRSVPAAFWRLCARMGSEEVGVGVSRALRHCLQVAFSDHAAMLAWPKVTFCEAVAVPHRLTVTSSGSLGFLDTLTVTSSGSLEMHHASWATISERCQKSNPPKATFWPRVSGHCQKKRANLSVTLAG